MFEAGARTAICLPLLHDLPPLDSLVTERFIFLDLRPRRFLKLFLRFPDHASS